MYRSGDRVDFNTLANQHVAILGMGGAGSYVAQLLPYPIGRLTLADTEILEKENIERHVLGYESVGEPKAQGVRKHLINRHRLDPNSVHALCDDAMKVVRSTKRLDLVVESTNNSAVRRSLDQWSRKHNVPVIYIGIYAGGLGWEVISLTQPQSVCFNCVELQRSLEEPEPELDDYGLVDERPQDLDAAIGLAPAVAQAAGMAAHVATEIMMGRPVQPALYRFAFEPRALLQLGDDESVRQARALLVLQRRFGVDQFSLEENRGGGFTLWQNSGSIPINIGQAARCPFH